MEPFFLRCETCHARLRVRDERFLGQVQSCPKCGSMVQIIAPVALAMAPADAIADAATTPSLVARATTFLREHALMASVGTGAVLIAGGLLGFLTLGGGDEVTQPTTTALAVAEQVTHVDEAASDEDEPVTETLLSEAEVRETPVVPSRVDEPEQPEVAAVEVLTLTEPASVTVPTPPMEEPAPPAEPTRTLTLEPVPSEPQLIAVNKPAVEEVDYPPSIEVAAVEAEPKPLASAPVAPPPRVTNFGDQLSVPIEQIDLPAIPIGEFVNLMSSMTAVPIKLDIKVLGEVGMSSRSTVTVRGENTTAGKLLAGVLRDHRLTCIERDGALVVVKAKR